MKAEIKPSYDTNRKRLEDVIPLASPFTLYIEPTKVCNFKCFYCMHSTRGVAGGEFQIEGFETRHMEPLFFEKLTHDIMEFEPKPKRVVFSGLGEPLCNHNLPAMVQTLRAAGFDGRVDVITNGFLLTPTMSDALVHAGVSRIQISLQGLDAQMYQEYCGVEMDYPEFLENLRYLYDHKGETEIFIKIIDALIRSKEQEKAFFDTFGNLCDTIFVEHLIVMQQQMGDHNHRTDRTRNLNNEEVTARDVCSVVFYHLQVSIEGYTFPCPVPGLTGRLSLGNAQEQSLAQIWHGEKRKRFMKLHLQKQRKKMDVCGTCDACAAVLDDNENLDPVADEILRRI